MYNMFKLQSLFIKTEIDVISFIELMKFLVTACKYIPREGPRSRTLLAGDALRSAVEELKENKKLIYLKENKLSINEISQWYGKLPRTIYEEIDFSWVTIDDVMILLYPNFGLTSSC